MLTDGCKYDYVTRTSQNQGILQTTGFVNELNINSAGTWSLGLLQMDFFYRNRKWYAGQFVRKIIPKHDLKLTSRVILYFSSLLNKQKLKLLSVLVRDVDETFKNIVINLPINENKEIDYNFIEAFIAELEAQRIAELEAQRIAELEAYLSATGLKDYKLTVAEQSALETYASLEFKDFDITQIFTVKNTGNILSRDIVENSGDTPYLCASADNNAVSSYIDYNKDFIDSGNCVFIGGKTFVVTYQENDFYSNDSHNLVLYPKENTYRDKINQFYLATCVNKSLKHKYSWGDSISSTKIKKDKISLPVKDGEPNYEIMKDFISATQKLVIKDVVHFADSKIEATKLVSNKMN